MDLNFSIFCLSNAVMPDIYILIVVLLFALAATDLIVGVSNDAVNFLNSAIGSKVAPRRTIMIVASLGILAGATFSSGMMEVARKGIFNPEHFFFSEIMVIFIAVMITDILLLDLFNTFGMPTSTTVSIVFELLGAAVAVSIIKINTIGESLGTLGTYINSSSAILIISGIFISILVAFAVGSFIQYISRLLFTFNLKKNMRWVGGVWSGSALTALTYFLLIKGMKGASFITDEFLNLVQQHTLLLIGGSFIFWSILMQLLLAYSKINILRIVVLFGTFSLAMAFAGNDLVNFIGVPIAGFESFNAWNSTGTEADAYPMSILNQPVRTQTYLLVIAGGIMITTLWFSKKARSVTETEVNLGRQQEGSERFSPNALSKGLVRYALFLGARVNQIIPNAWLEKAEASFQTAKEPVSSSDDDPPAFDLIRASVNLTVASILIAFATSLKLPLSTTYVSFMVAMGTSLSDRAWGRSSAVFRIAGVINVIGGWFFTAILAFTAAAVFATFIHFFGIWAIVILVLLAVFLISRTFLIHRRQEKNKSAIRQLLQQSRGLHTSGVTQETATKVGATLQTIRAAYRDGLSGLLQEDRQSLQKARKDILRLKTENKELKRHLYSLIKSIEKKNSEAGRIYLLVYDLDQDILQSILLIVKSCLEYVENSLEPIGPEQRKPLRAIMEAVDQYLVKLSEMIIQLQFEDLPDIRNQKQAIFKHLEAFLAGQVSGIQGEIFGMRNSLLMFSIMLETKDLIAVAARFAKLYQRVQQMTEQEEVLLVAGNTAKQGEV